MARITRKTLRDADSTFMWKLVLRTLSIILAAIAIGLIAWAELHTVIPVLEPQDDINNSQWYPGDNGGIYEDYLGGLYGGWPDDFTLPWEYISLGLSIVWNFTNISVWFTPSRSGRGVHPGANVGCDLILWMILLLTGTFSSFDADNYISQYGQYLYGSVSGETFSNGTQPTTLGNDPQPIDSNQCAPFLNCDAATAYGNGLKHKGIVIAVGVAFTFIVMLFHFALFISACRYTHARRYEKGGRYAKAIAEEATSIAAKMVSEMGYPSPGPGQFQIPPQPQGEQPTGAPMLRPYSFQPTSEMTPEGREMPNRYQQQMLEAQQQHDINAKGKEGESDLEQGQGLPENIAVVAGERSSG